MDPSLKIAIQPGRQLRCDDQHAAWLVTGSVALF
jgi:hypothetical protein